MSVTALLVSLPVALVGAYYLVNAASVAPLRALEGEHASRARVRLRRANGVVMILTGVALYLAISRTFPVRPAGHMGLVAPLAWIAILPLLVLMVLFALVDMRLTRKLRRDLLRRSAMNKARQQPQSDPPSAGTPRGTALLLAACLITGSAMRCEDASGQRQTSGTGTSPETRPTTGPSTRPTPMRDADVRERGPEEPQKLRTVEMAMGEGKVILQVADEPHEREAGLMYRTSLAPDEGMIFIFPDVRYLSFWMKNTYIPLDIVFVSADGRVLNIEQMAARDLRGHESAGPAKYAIELPLGAARRLKLEKGMQLDIPENARIAAE